MEYRITKRTLGPGWPEITIVMRRPDTPDYSVSGDVARERIAHTFLSGAAGIASGRGDVKLARRLKSLGVEMGITTYEGN